MSESVPFYELTYESTFKGMQKVSEIKEELDLAEDESKRIDILNSFKVSRPFILVFLIFRPILGTSLLPSLKFNPS